VDGASHPLVFGDELMTYLNQLVTMFNAHLHPGELAACVLPSRRHLLSRRCSPRPLPSFR